MTGVDELDGEIRRAVMELGDAVGPARRFDQLDGSRRRRATPSAGRAVLVVGAVAVLVVAGLYAIAVVGDDATVDPVDRPTPTPATSTAGATTAPGWSTTTVPAASRQASALEQLVVPVIPDGFTLLSASGPRPVAVAYDERGVRFEIAIDLDRADQVRGQIGGDLTASDVGEITSDGRMLLTTVGDVISVEFSLAGCICHVELLDDLRRSAPDVITTLAARLDTSTRSQLRDLATPQVNTADLRQGAADLLRRRVDQVGGERLVGSWDFNVSARSLSETGEESTSIEAIRAEHRRLPDGLRRTSENIVSASTWVNGWQLVVSSVGTDGTSSPVTDTEVEALIDDAAALFAVWTDVDDTLPGCATHIVAVGDSFDSIARRYDRSIDELRRVNADLDALLQIGRGIEIPCPAQRAAIVGDQSAADSFDHTTVFSGFEIVDTIRFATERFVYVVSGGEGNTGGAVLIEHFDRSTGESVGVTEAPIPACAGPVELDTPVDDPARIGFTCTATGVADTIDVFTAQTQSFVDQLGGPTE